MKCTYDGFLIPTFQYWLVHPKKYQEGLDCLNFEYVSQLEMEEFLYQLVRHKFGSSSRMLFSVQE